jgi:hypothetical protein
VKRETAAKCGHARLQMLTEFAGCDGVTMTMLYDVAGPTTKFSLRLKLHYMTAKRGSYMRLCGSLLIFNCDSGMFSHHLEQPGVPIFHQDMSFRE